MFQQGEIETERLTLAKKVLISHAREMFDKQRQMIDLLHTHARYQSVYNYDDWIKEIESITIEDIKKTAQLGQLDTIYILTEGDNNA